MSMQKIDLLCGNRQGPVEDEKELSWYTHEAEKLSKICIAHSPGLRPLNGML